MKNIKGELEKYKLFFIFISLGLLIGLFLASIALSVLMNGENWSSNWRTYVYPIIADIILTPVLLGYIYFKIHKRTKENANSNKLATSRWMSKKEFNSKFSEYSLKGLSEKSFIPLNHPQNWIVSTSNKNGTFTWRQAKTDGHAMVIGSTGSGKTALLLNPQIRILAISCDQPTMIFSDPKGELFQTHSQFLKDKGYEIISINLRDKTKSSNWNPLEPIWNLWQEGKKEDAIAFLSELSSSIFVPPKGDAIWVNGASTIFQFMVLSLLELQVEKGVTKKHFNITNIVYNINKTTYDELQEIIKELPPLSKALSVGGRNVRGAENTVNGMVMTCITTLGIYNDPTIKHVSSKNSWGFNLSRPQAIFLIVPDETKAKHPFVSLFVSQTYKELIQLASSNTDGKLSRRIYYILDEFGNIPKIPGMDSMITVARSRNIFFMLALQGYAQLNETYGKDVANTIISNCMFEYFLLTADGDTASKFSKKLGQKSLVKKSKGTSSSERGTNSSSNESEQTRNLIHADELMRMQFGHFVLSIQRELPIQTEVTKFWETSLYSTGAAKMQKVIIDQEYDNNHLLDLLKSDHPEREIEFDELDFNQSESNFEVQDTEYEKVKKIINNGKK